MLIANLLGISVLIYVFWKKLKDDYHYEKIFNLAFVLLTFFIVSVIITKFIPSDFNFWISLFALSLGFYIGIRKQKMSLFESLDAFVVGSLPWLGLVYLFDTTKNSSLYSFIGFWFALICIFLYSFISSTYKGYSWYKSGRVGIAGVITGIVFFALRIISSIFMPSMLFIADGFEIYLSLSGALLFFILLYNLMKE